MGVRKRTALEARREAKKKIHATCVKCLRRDLKSLDHLVRTSKEAVLDHRDFYSYDSKVVKSLSLAENYGIDVTSEQKRYEDLIAIVDGYTQERLAVARGSRKIVGTRAYAPDLSPDFTNVHSINGMDVSPSEQGGW